MKRLATIVSVRPHCLPPSICGLNTVTILPDGAINTKTLTLDEHDSERLAAFLRTREFLADIQVESHIDQDRFAITFDSLTSR